jgi:DNA adenine methylase
MVGSEKSSMSEVKRPVLRYHGGKWMLAPWIIEYMPAHRVYTEPFGGAGSVLMRKPRAQMVEIYNDLDSEVGNVFRILRDPTLSAELERMLRLTPYSRVEFDLSYEPANNHLEQARRTIVRAFLGFGSDSSSGAKTGFRANGNRQCTHPSRDWVNYPGAIENFTERLQGVVLENRDACEIITQHDARTTLHYCDPPYVHSTRSTAVLREGKGYRHEMSDDDHIHLAETLHAVEGMVILSGYANDLYDKELFADWSRIERSAHADGALDRIEVLWLNSACVQALENQTIQHRMFA